MNNATSWRFWVLIVFLVVAYFFLHLALGLGLVIPDLLTVALLLSARRLSAPVAAGLGFVLGLLRDSLSLVAFGADAIVLTVLGYLGSRSKDYFIGDSLLFVGIYLLIGTLIHDLVYHLILGSSMGWRAADFVSQLPFVFYTAVAGLGLLLIYRLMARER